MINNSINLKSLNNDEYKNSKDKLKDKTITTEKNNLIEQRNNFNLSLRKQKIYSDIMKFRKSKKNKLNNVFQNNINLIEIEKNIPENILLEFNYSKRENKISVILRNLNQENGKDLNFNIRLYCLIQLQNYLKENNTINLKECSKILQKCFEIFYDENLEKNKTLKINIQNKLILIFIEITEEISEKNPDLLLYDEIFLKDLSRILNSNEYNNDFKNNIFKLIGNLIYEKQCFNKVNRIFNISQEISKFLSKIENDEHYNSIFFIMYIIIIHTNSDEDMSDKDYIIYFNDIYLKLIFMLNYQYKKYKNLYSEKIPNIQLSPYYRNIKYLLRFFRACLHKQNIKFYSWTLIQSKQFYETLVEILKDFNEEYYKMDNSKNILKLNDKFSIEIKPKVGKYILYNEKIFRIIAYNFAYLFGVTVPDENKEKMSILEFFYENIKNLKLIPLYKNILEKSLNYYHLDYSSLKLICILINNYSIENLSNTKELIIEPSILKYLIEYFKIIPEVDFRREFLRTIINIIFSNDKEVIQYIYSNLFLIKILADLINNDYKNTELMLLSLEIINIFIEYFNSERMYKSKNELFKTLETNGAINAIRDHLTISNNDDISEISSIIICYLSDMAIDYDVFNNFNGENESDSENISI